MDPRQQVLRVTRGVARRARRTRQRGVADWRRVADTWDKADSHHLLVRDPVFVFSSVRSGSTLLRVILDTHSQIVAPHEMHFRNVRVKLNHKLTNAAFRELGISTETLENMLWDRIFAELLANSGKSVVVDKTPSNTVIWRRVSEWWPDARFLFLLRHPAHIAESLIAARPRVPLSDNYERANKYLDALHEARSNLPGLDVRYEDLTARPEAEVKRICDWLGVPWEPTMLDYGAKERTYTRGLGDWSETLKSAEIRPPRELPKPEDVPAEMRLPAERFGYL
jgi:Sulfotransferase family